LQTHDTYIQQEQRERLFKLGNEQHNPEFGCMENVEEKNLSIYMRLTRNVRRLG